MEAHLVVDDFENKINQLGSRLSMLTRDRSLTERERLQRAINALHASLEDLRGAEGELRDENEALIGARNAIDDERRRYRDLFEFAPDAYFVSDIFGTITEANQAARQIFHTEQIVGSRLAAFIVTSERARFRSWLAEVLARSPRTEVGFLVQPRDGAIVHASFTARCVSDALGNPIAIRWQIRDVTGHVQTEERLRIMNEELERRVEARTEELRRASSVKDELLGLVSHELKTPITTIYGNAQVLRRHAEMLNAADRSTAVADIEEEAGRLQRLIDDLLVLAKIETGNGVVTEPLLVQHAVQRVVDQHRRKYGHRTINVIDGGGAPPVAADPTYFEQIVRNLLGNAEKYSPPDRPIDIRIHRDGREVIVAVLDRGTGIAEDEAAVIFTPFFRSQRTVHTAGGVGIGLAVCRRLVEAQHGRIWARPREGGGSEFAFALPLDND